MSILYKKPEDVTVKCNVEQKDGLIIFKFSADVGKHGADEPIGGYAVKPKNLLEILTDNYNGWINQEYEESL